MWFKSKNVKLDIMDKPLDMSWEELGIFVAELALQNAFSEIEYIKNKCPTLVSTIQKKVSPLITLSFSFHLGVLQHGLLYCKDIDKYPYFAEVQNGINKGILNLGNDNQKIFTKEHLQFVNDFMADYRVRYNRTGFNSVEYASLAIGHSTGYFHAQNIFSIYNIDTPENIPLKYMLTEYFDSIYLELMEMYHNHESLKCYKCNQRFLSAWSKGHLSARNPWVKHCKNCDYEIK